MNDKEQNGKILAEIILKEMTERKLTLRTLMLALKIIREKFYYDATI